MTCSNQPAVESRSNEQFFTCPFGIPKNALNLSEIQGMHSSMSFHVKCRTRIRSLVSMKRRLSGVVSFTWRLWKGFFQQTLFTTIRPQQSLKLKCNVKKHASDLFVCVVRRFLQRKLALFSLKCEPYNVVASLLDLYQFWKMNL